MKQSHYIYPKELLFWRSVPIAKMTGPFKSNYRLSTFNHFLSSIPNINRDLFLDELLNDNALKEYKLRIILPMPANCTDLLNTIFHKDWYELFEKCCQILKKRTDAVLITGCDFDEFNLLKFHNKSLIHQILNILRSHKISLNRLTWLHCNAFTDDYIKLSLTNNEIEPLTIYYNDYIHQTYGIDYIESNTVKTNWFLSPNRIARPHRMILCYWWFLNGRRPSFISCRLGKDDSNKITDQYDTVDKLAKDIKHFNYSVDEDKIEKFLYSLPWSIDFKDSHNTLPIEYQNSLDKKIIEASACYLITETSYPLDNSDHYRGWITEKTFKSFVYKLPFIMIGPAEAVATIKKIGFKSFSTLIDETYDMEFDNVKRMSMILNEINKIQQIEDIDDWYHQADEIYSHNINHLLNLRNRNYYKIIEEFYG